VAAKVNKEEISVHQINFVLQRTPGVTPESADAASRQILERLIGQELAVQKAQELKLDRTPNVVQQLEAARRDVLARAYLDSLGQNVAKPTPEEVAKFYAERPALFKNRKYYTLEEATIIGTPAEVAQVEAQLKASRSPADFAAWLKASGLRHQTNLATQPAENLPLELIDRLAALNDGQAIALKQPGGMRVLMLLGSRPAPVDEATARPAIEQFIVNDRRRAQIDADMKALRTAATVEFMGKFAEAPAAGTTAPAPATAAVPAAGTAPASTAPAPTAAAPGTAPAAPAAMDADAVKKGLGLK
jgi:EpsD family peptidyl-prolyl cis-trans isomerase